MKRRAKNGTSHLLNLKRIFPKRSLKALAFSTKTLNEFRKVILRKKFDRYFISTEERLELLNEVANSIKQFFPVEDITASRDPKDDKFLELAVAANASCINSGDKDLLVLHPFRGIPILNAADFLKNF